MKIIFQIKMKKTEVTLTIRKAALLAFSPFSCSSTPCMLDFSILRVLLMTINFVENLVHFSTSLCVAGFALTFPFLIKTSCETCLNPRPGIRRQM